MVTNHLLSWIIGTDWQDSHSCLGFETNGTETLGLGLPPILIIDKSRSRTPTFVYLSRSLWLVPAQNIGNMKNLSSCSCLILETTVLCFTWVER